MRSSAEAAADQLSLPAPLRVSANLSVSVVCVCDPRVFPLRFLLAPPRTGQVRTVRLSAVILGSPGGSFAENSALCMLESCICTDCLCTCLSPTRSSNRDRGC